MKSRNDLHVLMNRRYGPYLLDVCKGRSRNSDMLRAGRSGDRILLGVRFSTPIQTGPGAHPASYKMGTGSLSRWKSDRGVALTTHPI